MTVSDLARIVEGEILSAEDRSSEPITGCYIGDLLSWVMGRAKLGDCWITIMTNLNVVGVAVLADVACVLLPEGAKPDEAMRAKAQSQDVCLVSTQKTAFECAQLIARHLC